VSTAPGRIMGRPSVKALRKRLSGKVADHPSVKFDQADRPPVMKYYDSISATRLGPYEIQSQLVAGGMGEVYRAVDARLDRMVAIKVLPEAVANDPERLQRFEQ
jgi:serine/threonine protein kinase